MSPATGLKRKRIDVQSQNQGRKRRAVRKSDDAPPSIEQLEQRITEDPSKNRKDVDGLLQMLDLARPDARTNLKVGITLCKVFSRLVASGNLTKDSHKSKDGQELCEWYTQELGKYRTILVRLLRSVAATQRLPILHLCWKVLEQDAELLDNSVWMSHSMFKPLLLAVIEDQEGTDIRETFVGEYLNPCHDCCYHSLEYLSYVRFRGQLQPFPNISSQGHTLLQVTAKRYWKT